jgi:amidase
MSLWQPNSWQKSAEDKKARISSSIPSAWLITVPFDSPDSVMGLEKSCGFMTEEELIITGSSAVDLVKKMAAGELRSETVTTAFCKRAALAHQLVCIPI